jgi:hypothetical protein
MGIKLLMDGITDIPALLGLLLLCRHLRTGWQKECGCVQVDSMQRGFASLRGY